MKTYFKLFLIFIFAVAHVLAGQNKKLPQGFPETERQKINLNVEWLYHIGDAKNNPHEVVYDDSGWEKVVLPHTYKLTTINLDDCEDDKSQPTFHRDVSWYRREIAVNAKPGQRVFLEFEGAHQKTDLWVNGAYVGEHAISAYTPFHFDITDHVKSGQKNLIAIKLDNRTTDQIPPDGHKWDYILFGGLYRDVYLVVTDPLHVTFPWEKREAGIFITTPTVSKDDATISIRTTVRNASDRLKKATVVSRVLDADNKVVLKLKSKAPVPAGMDHTFLHTGGIDENVRLWSFDDPYLYRVNTQILDGEKIVDVVVNPLGLRWFEMRPDAGLLLNGEPVELVGVNRHQQFPYVGDAMPNSLHWADAVKMKKAGMNIVRLAHYPQDDAFFDACDKLGMLICEEPPTWIEFGPEIWMDRLEESFRRTIRNHRNHPSVWGWGAGINHRGPLKRLQYASKEEDPTRVTMNNGTVWTGPQNSGVTDVFAVMDYRNPPLPDGEYLFAMEHSGSRDTRKLQHIVSKYKAEPRRIGLTSWSAHDNYSFADRQKTIPNLSRWSAATWDAFRFPLPTFYWYKSELTTKPMVKIADDLAQKDSLLVVFSNCDELEILQDGKSLGKFKPSDDPKRAHLNSPSFEMPFEWKSGEITAKGFIDGKHVTTDKKAKPGKAHQLKVFIDEDCAPFYADGSSIFFAWAEMQDKRGNRIEKDTPMITFEIDGPAEIVGDASIGANPVTWQNGFAPVLIRADRMPGKITVKAKTDGLKSGRASFQTIAWSNDEIARHAKPIFEPLRLKVDLGAPEQHPQEDFILWSEKSGVNAEKKYVLENGIAIKTKLETTADSLNWMFSWGVPGDLSFMIEDGVSIPASKELHLVFENLPAGEYLLKTWHHVLTGKRAEAPSFKIQVDDSGGKGRMENADYSPTFGRKIKVSGAGVGGAGDGGSNLGAAGFAQINLQSDGKTPVIVKFIGKSDIGTIKLNGFDLEAELK
ncbi:MAG: glycoside hydrolase family 2 protein [Calditrichaeota bacterium]|nr:MAG: glycoside hydrolase family 2 protein [Calditrichota bacterium]